MFPGKRECTEQDLGLVGSLSFACKFVVLGRAFPSCSIQFCDSINELHYYAHLDNNSKKGSIHFFVKVNLLNAIVTPENDLTDLGLTFKSVFKFNSF